MNPSPAELWLREQTVRFNNGLPMGDIDSVWLPDPWLLPPCVTNSVARPLDVRFPDWFDVRQKSDGAQLAHELGVDSSYFQEYQSWAPTLAGSLTSPEPGWRSRRIPTC